MTPQRRTRILVLVGALLLGPPLLLTLLLLPAALRPPSAFFEARRSEHHQVRVDSTWVEGSSLISDIRISGDGPPAVSFQAYLCRPADPAGPLPAIILSAGYRTGREAVRMISSRSSAADRAVYLCMDYPWEGPRRFTGLQFVSYLPRIRRALFDGVEAVRLALDVLEETPPVDPGRIVLLGASFGSFYAVDAGGVDPRPAAVIAFMGGGDLSGLLGWNMRQTGFPGGRLLRGPLAGLAAFSLRPLEPLRLVGGIAPTPFVQINAREDARIPERYAHALFDAASQPKRLIWMETGHVLPGLEEIIDEMVTLTLLELERMGILTG